VELIHDVLTQVSLVSLADGEKFATPKFRPDTLKATVEAPDP
jgi:hypothetical protein